MSDEIILSEDDVVFVDRNSISSTPTSTIRELMERLKFRIHGNYDGDKQAALEWVENGAICKLLSAQGGGWQKGKIRIRFEFIPNEPKVLQLNPSTVTSEPESPLDDLRATRGLITDASPATK